MWHSCPPELFFATFLKLVVEMKASGPPHVFKTVVGSKQGHAAFRSNKACFVSVECDGDHKTVTRLR